MPDYQDRYRDFVVQWRKLRSQPRCLSSTQWERDTEKSMQILLWRPQNLPRQIWVLPAPLQPKAAQRKFTHSGHPCVSSRFRFFGLYSSNPTPSRLLSSGAQVSLRFPCQVLMLSNSSFKFFA